MGLAQGHIVTIPRLVKALRATPLVLVFFARYTYGSSASIFLVMVQVAGLAALNAGGSLEQAAGLAGAAAGDAEVWV